MANKCNGQIYCVKKYKKSRLMKTRGLSKVEKFSGKFFKKRRLKIN